MGSSDEGVAVLKIQIEGGCNKVWFSAGFAENS